MSMRNTDYIIQAAFNGQMAFCKFLSANDTGLTGGHQSGIYIPKAACSILFDGLTCESRPRGTNIKEKLSITWQDGRETESVATYYGQGTRDEFRLTSFGRGFSYLTPYYTGALFVLVRNYGKTYEAFVLNEEEDIEYFLSSFNIGTVGPGYLYDKNSNATLKSESSDFKHYLFSLPHGFPPASTITALARQIENKLHNHAEYILTNPDVKLINWINMEYSIFRYLEERNYSDKLHEGFKNVEEFVIFANEVLNRRKSRAGKSLEQHLAEIFHKNNLKFTSQPKTEGNKHPDFIFPSEEAYHNMNFNPDFLITLAAKTTCKDRWRQILNEADRLRGKRIFLCTLQQGMSPAQMEEMQSEKVTLVVPKPYIKDYPPDMQGRIWTLAKFIEHVKELEGRLK